jgi:hypothetical protein
MAMRTEVGELRSSQLLHTFGIGSIVDLPNLSTLVMGLEEWDPHQTKTIVEERLLAAVQRQLGEQVERLVLPPIDLDDKPGDLTGNGWRGAPVATFPSFLLCPLCNRLGPRRKGIFDLRIDRVRMDRTGYVHTNCQKSTGKRKPTAVPARFLVACERGHLDDFPWVTFVHRGKTDCTGELTFTERGVSADATYVTVKCKACSATRVMADAFSDDGMAGYKCRGRRPHLRDFQEGCDTKPRAILLGASNSWFAVTLSVLYVPPSLQDERARLVEERWTVLSDVESLGTVGYLRKRGELGPLARFSDMEVLAAIEARRKGVGPEKDTDLKAPEWRVFTSPGSVPSGPDFQLRTVEPPRKYASLLDTVVLADRLREVTALTGFTRVSSPLDFDDAFDQDSQHRMALSRLPPSFVPAAEVRGEGIFLRFAEAEVAEWCARNEAREGLFRRAHIAWRKQRAIAHPEKSFPGLRFILLHTFAHTLMRQLAVECGYTAASIRERIYSKEPFEEGGPMAGVLLYTSAPDSEGTLGGLVSLGRPEQLGRLIDQALEDVRLCASDPLCSEHQPSVEGGPRTLHGAACHACAFAPETSCERGNKYLDRTVLVDTVSGALDSFFDGWTRRG